MSSKFIRRVTGILSALRIFFSRIDIEDYLLLILHYLSTILFMFSNNPLLTNFSYYYLLLSPLAAYSLFCFKLSKKTCDDFNYPFVMNPMPQSYPLIDKYVGPSSVHKENYVQPPMDYGTMSNPFKQQIDFNDDNFNDDNFNNNMELNNQIQEYRNEVEELKENFNKLENRVNNLFETYVAKEEFKKFSD